MLKYVDTKNAPAAIGPYSQGIILNGIAFFSGQIPLGDINGTVQLLISCNPGLDFIFHRTLRDEKGERREFTLETTELRQVLGEDVPLDTPDVVLWIKDYLSEQTAELLEPGSTQAEET